MALKIENSCGKGNHSFEPLTLQINKKLITVRCTKCKAYDKKERKP